MLKNFVAKTGCAFPLKYQGKLMVIQDKPVELDVDKMDYITKIQFKKAIKDAEVLESEPESKAKAKSAKDNNKIVQGSK